MANNNNNNDVVMLNLDRPRELRFGHKALKKLSALTGKGLDQLEDAGFDLEQIEMFLYCGLLSDAQDNGETLELEQMENLLDKARPYSAVIQGMQAAFAAAFGSMSGGNVQVPAIPPAWPKKQRSSTGKPR